MWFFVAVLVLWGTTLQLASWDDWVLSPVTQWSWWTFNLYVCGVAATTTRFLTLADRLMGVFGFALVVVYYRTMHETYLKFVPADTANPDMWPMIFLVMNLIGPLLLIVVGLVHTAVQER